MINGDNEGLMVQENVRIPIVYLLIYIELFINLDKIVGSKIIKRRDIPPFFLYVLTKGGLFSVKYL